MATPRSGATTNAFPAERAIRGCLLLLGLCLTAIGAPGASARPTDPGDPNAYPVPEHTPPDCGAHVCVHWVESGPDAPPGADISHNGIPDAVDRTLAYAEDAYGFQVGTEGWRPPPSDGAIGDAGDSANQGKLDVYVTNLRAGGFSVDVLGATSGQIDPASGTASGYILLNNDFSKEINLVSAEQTTAIVLAHEFNHVLQLGYDDQFDDWMAESTAEWMAFHEFSNSIGQEGAFAVWAAESGAPLAANPLNGAEPANAYGYAIWDWWLAARYGDGVIRDAWTDLRTSSPQGYGVGAFDAAIRAAGGGGFSAEFARFAAASAELNSASFPLTDSVVYPDLRRRGVLRVGHRAAVRLDHTSFVLFECEPAHGFHLRRGRSVTLSATAPKGIYSAFALIGRTPRGRVVTALALAPKGGRRSLTLRHPGRFKRITAALINADGSISGGAPNHWEYRADGQSLSAELTLGGAD